MLAPRAFESLADLAEERRRALTEGAWPPKGGPDWLDPEMISLVAPLGFSPPK